MALKKLNNMKISKSKIRSFIRGDLWGIYIESDSIKKMSFEAFCRNTELQKKILMEIFYCKNKDYERAIKKAGLRG